MLCDQGSGRFEAQFYSGVSVRVGAARNGDLAVRKCEAELSWDHHQLPVATDASQVDLDAFGVDLGLGTPVAAFQVKGVESDCCVEYRIYSLGKPPRLLRTLKAGAAFAAADKDLDGKVEIWTDDSATIAGFEGLSLAEFDSAPKMVLRFSQGKLLDVSSEFQSDFDADIAKLQAKLNRDDARDFKEGIAEHLPSGPRFAERLHRLQIAKTEVLQIVWSFLYSGRERQAWRSLAEMWPAQDLNRIRGLLLEARARGIRSQVDGVSPSTSGRKKHSPVFDAMGDGEVRAPEPILLTRPETDLSESESALILVIDSAGKVRSVEAMGKSPVDPALARAAGDWKFRPASKAGRAVACRSRISVSSRR
ncbi:MAG TPA: hypothetical protein VFA68_17990 [Terriglobales bacterium]|nr:hypothetical protein [Terriglobales bacterium]